MINTEVASLIAKLSLDTSDFVSNANSINAKSVKKSVQSALDDSDIEIDIEHSNLAAEAEEEVQRRDLPHRQEGHGNIRHRGGTGFRGGRQKKLLGNDERRFVLRLALQLGYANPDAMLREMTSGQLYEWIAFYQLEPWGAETLDYQFAHFKALYVNAHLKKGKRQYKPEKFLIFPEKKKGGSPAPDMPDDEDEWL